MKKLVYTILMIFPFGLFSQTVHDIEAGGGGTLGTPYYSPQFITIMVGDIVRWTNSGGTHNVDGTTETFPNNPEGFTNGLPSNSLWVFEHTFTIPGEYDFECAAFDHNQTQFGTITVSPVGVEELNQAVVDVFPNPSNGIITISTESQIERVDVFDVKSSLIISQIESGSALRTDIDLTEFDSGSYVIKVSTNAGVGYETIILK